MQYHEVKDARPMEGIRLVLTKGQPGLWGQAAKKMLEYKSLAYVPVAQHAGEPNEALVEWTGHRNAPVLIHNDGAPVSRWDELIAFIDDFKAEPPLRPSDRRMRSRMFEIVAQIADEGGYGWCARLMIFHKIKSRAAAKGEYLPGSMSMLLVRYGYSDESAARAPQRCADILQSLSDQLHEQRKAGSHFFVGTAVSAADIYWACFSNLLAPWPVWASDVKRSPSPTRGPTDPSIVAERDDILLEHRDRMFREYLRPITF